MSLLFAEGFDGISETELRKIVHLPSTNMTVTLPARGTGNYLTMSAISSDRVFGINFAPATSDTIIIGFDVYMPTVFDGSYILAGAYDSADCQLDKTSTASALATVYTGGTSRGTYNMTVDSWVNVEVKCYKHASSGTIEIRENGVQVFSWGPGDTFRVAGNWSYLTGIVDLSRTLSLDNLYICDGAGSVNNDFLGIVTIETLYPNANGNTSDFVGSDADSTDNYLLVDETTPDDDTTYTESKVIDEKDTYNYGNMSVSGVVVGVVVSSYVRLVTSGRKEVCHVCRSNGTDYVKSNRTLVTPEYHFVNDIWELDPDTSAAWSEAGVNAAEFGLQVKV